MKSLLIAATAVILTGCLPTPPSSSSYSASPRAYSPPVPTPVCKTSKQCEAMWVESQTAIQALTLMKIQLATESRIETYNPTRAGRLGGSVSKVPVDATAYEIRANLWCPAYVNCDDIISTGMRLFNTRVTAAGVPFEPPPPAAAEEKPAPVAEQVAEQPSKKTGKKSTKR